MDRILNVGLIGLGSVAQIVHIPVLSELQDKYSIKGICDISPGLSGYIGNRYNIANRYTDYMDLIVQDDIDVIFILNSDEFHSECAIAAANHKKHVFIEKPMCLTQREADEIIQAKNDNNVSVFIGYMRRYSPCIDLLVEETKKLNKINHVTIRDIICQNNYYSKQVCQVHTFNDIPEHEHSKRKSQESKLLMEIGLMPGSRLASFYRYLAGLSSHSFSAMRDVLGMPKKVTGAQIYDNSFFSCMFDYGDFGVIYETGVDLNGRFDSFIEVNSHSKHLKLKYDAPYVRQLPIQLTISETIGDEYTTKIIRPTFTDPYTLELRYLYEVIVKGAKYKTTPEDYTNDLEIFKMVIDKLK